ncbi:MAG: MgtC/SapB family protein [Bacilli bacterium]|nr:MgtC/SapB family protein [Bacilli bacterium]
MNFLTESTKYFFEVDIVEQILRVLAAMFVGAIFGFEREMKGKPAGFVTFMIVSMGACIIALLQINTINMIYDAIKSSNDQDLTSILNADLTRIIAQVVSGIGFLGAGTIIYSKGSIKGITTAAMLWVSAGLGLLIGIGGVANYIVAGTVVVLFIPIMIGIRVIGRKVTEKYRNRRVFVTFEEEHEKELFDKFDQNDVHIKKTFFHNKYQKEGIHYKEIIIYFTPNRAMSYDELINALFEEDWILSIEEM